MNIKFYIASVLVIALNYYLSARSLYDVEFKFNKDSISIFNIPIEKVIRTKFLKFLFPKPILKPSENYGEPKIYILGLFHYLIFYIPTQTGYLISLILSFFNFNVANQIANKTYKFMWLGLILQIVFSILLSLIEKIYNSIKSKKTK